MAGHLGEPSTAGGQDDLKYAYFADRRRLAVSRTGRVTVYDTADHQISGVAQHQAGEQGDVSFASLNGEVSLGSLKLAD